MTPAEELRAAAAKIRDYSVRTFRTLAQREVEWRDAVKDVGGRGNPNVWTDYAATMDPAASIFLANMLEGIADVWEALDRHNTQTTAGQEYPDEPQTYWLEARRFAEIVLNMGRAGSKPEASVTQPLPTANPEITIQDRGWELAAYDADGTYLGGARRNCVGGSRGQSWYWSVEVRGADLSEARRKPEARADLLRIATEVVEAREVSAAQPLPDRTEADQYLPKLDDESEYPDCHWIGGCRNPLDPPSLLCTEHNRQTEGRYA